MASLLLADWFGSAVVGKLIDLGFTYLQNHFFWQTGMKKDRAEKIAGPPPKDPNTCCCFNSSRDNGLNPDVKKWLWQLQDVVDQADDLLDELEYNELAKQVHEADLNKVRNTSSAFRNCCLNPKFSERIVKEDPTLNKLRKVVKRLDEVFAGAGNLLQFVENTRDEVSQQKDELYKVRETGSLPKTDMFGHERERENYYRMVEEAGG